MTPAARNVEPILTRSSSRSLPDAILFYGVFSLLLLGPLAFGAVEPWAIFILETATAVLFMLWLVRQIFSSELQLAPSPLLAPVLAFASLALIQMAFHLTAYRYATLSQTLLYGAYGALCFLAVQVLRRTWQVHTLAWAFTVYGFAVALFALIQSLAPNGKLYWLRTPRFGGWIYGPYVNHNHYAGLMEMLLPIPLVFVFTRYGSSWRKAMAALAAAFMASTIFLSGSRGGMLALAVQITIFVAILLLQKKAGRMVLTFGVFLALAIGLLAWLGGGELVERIASIHSEARMELSGAMRVNIDRDALRMFEHKPVLGWGLGTFAEVYPEFRSFYTNFFVDKAHNDYLQLLVEMGTLGFATMLWFLITVYYRATKKLKNWTVDTNGALSLAAILGITGILVHGFLDFNLQIPANAALFYVLCALAAMEPRFGLSRRTSR
ncbi:MAG TPA: O-antigen ligase family protein [Terriglobales bacterium]|nr:O-antigen ligase family protein [Terriglobales bacterium]